MILKLKLFDMTGKDLLEDIKDVQHEDWFWHLQSCCSLDRGPAYCLTVALHIDLNVDFEEALCIVTPYSPWSPAI